jgi:hypothetical protein
MTRSYWLLAISLVGFGLVFAWQQTRADDDIQNEAAIPSAVTVSQADLLARIETLEKRIAKLEAEKSPIQQADNRETLFIPAPRTLPQVAPLENENPGNKTNGTTWRIRMLSHRSSGNRPN